MIKPPGGQSDTISQSPNDWGVRLQYQGFYHFAPTRTMLETRVSIAGSDERNERFRLQGAPGPGPAPGLVTLDADAAGRFRSDMIFNDQYIGLRDRFDLSQDLRWLGLGGRNWGTVDIGCGLARKNFRQDFGLNIDVNGGSAQLATVEELDSDYFGGEVVATWTRRGFGRNWMLDTSVGYFDLDLDYEGSAQLDGVEVDSLH